MAAHIGTWVYSDTLKTVTVTFETPAGTAFNLTSYTPKLEVKRIGHPVLAATITGAIVSAALGTASFYLGTTAALQPDTPGAVWQYEAMGRLEQGTDVTFAGCGVDGGDPLTFSVRRWP
jgi:hypothetical protein